MRAEAYRIALAKAHGLATDACTPTDPKPHSNPNPFLNPYLTPTLTLTLTLALALTLILAPALTLTLECAHLPTKASLHEAEACG